MQNEIEEYKNLATAELEDEYRELQIKLLKTIKRWGFRNIMVTRMGDSLAAIDYVLKERNFDGWIDQCFDEQYILTSSTPLP